MTPFLDPPNALLTVPSCEMMECESGDHAGSIQACHACHQHIMSRSDTLRDQQRGSLPLLKIVRIDGPIAHVLARSINDLDTIVLMGILILERAQHEHIVTASHHNIARGRHRSLEQGSLIAVSGRKNMVHIDAVHSMNNNT